MNGPVIPLSQYRVLVGAYKMASFGRWSAVVVRLFNKGWKDPEQSGCDERASKDSSTNFTEGFHNCI